MDQPAGMRIPRTKVARKSLGRPRDVDSAETRNNLLEAARRSFSGIGYAATTNRTIAADVGITTGAIYHYFPSKAELYAAVYAQVQDIVSDRFERAVDVPGTLSERFSGALLAAVELNRADPSLYGFVVNVPAEVKRHNELAIQVAPIRNRLGRFIRRVVADAAARGELVDGVDPSVVEDLLSSMVTGLAMFSTLTGDEDRHEAAVLALQRCLDGTLVKTTTLRSD